MEPLLQQLPHQLLHGHPSSAQALTSMRESLLTTRCEEARESLLTTQVKTYERPRVPNFSAGPGALFEDVFEPKEILVNKEYQMQLSEGSGHKGQSALIDFVAKC